MIADIICLYSEFCHTYMLEFCGSLVQRASPKMHDNIINVRWTCKRRNERVIDSRNVNMMVLLEDQVSNTHYEQLPSSCPYMHLQWIWKLIRFTNREGDSKDEEPQDLPPHLLLPC